MTDRIIPRPTAARFPAEYGDPPTELRPWNEVAALIASSPNYLLATTNREQQPYVRPVDGVFVDDTLCFGGSPETRWVRHLKDRPTATAALPDPDQAIILEGHVELVTDAALPLAASVMMANLEKYPQYFPTEPDGPPTPFWALRPHRVYAWSLSGFPRGATRFDFEQADDNH